jgi:hypothetical protein
METKVTPAARAFFERLIDYAGAFPPASLSRQAAVANFVRYRHRPHQWMLRFLVIAADDLPHIPRELDGALSVLTETDEPRASAIEAKRIIAARRPVYCEVPLGELDAVKRAGHFAKLRTGGVKPEAIPSIIDVAEFIRGCAERQLPFKATAGLHHAIRGEQPLTYEPNPTHAVMHGFLNVFFAACMAWRGDADIEPILAETDPTAFRFDDSAHWRNRSLSEQNVRASRTQFAHAFGSCSFDEPVRDLEMLGFL